MDNLEVIFNQFLAQDDSFQNDISINDNDITQRPTNILLKLHDQKYNFTQKQFDLFFSRGIKGLSKSYFIFNDGDNVSNKRLKAIDIMFTKFTPNNKQMIQLLKTYITRLNLVKYTRCYQCVETLVGKKHQFTTEQLEIINRIEFDKNLYLLFKNTTLEEFENLIINTSPIRSSIIRILNNIIKNHNLVLLQRFIDIVCDQISNYTNDYRTRSTIPHILKLLDMLVDNGLHVATEHITKLYTTELDCVIRYCSKFIKNDLDKVVYYLNAKDILNAVTLIHTNKCIPSSECLNIAIKINNTLIDQNISIRKIIGDHTVNKNTIDNYDNWYRRQNRIFSLPHYLLDKGAKPNIESIKTLFLAIRSDSYNRYSDYHEIIYDKITSMEGGVNIDINLLNVVSKNPIYHHKIHDILSKGVVPNTETFDICITSLTDILREVELLEIHGLVLEKDMQIKLLDKIYFSNHYQTSEYEYGMFSNIVQKYKIIITKEHLIKALCYKPVTFVNEILNYKIKPDKEVFCKYTENGNNISIQEKFDILLCNGMEVDMDIVRACFKKEFYPELEKFNISYDESIYRILYDTNKDNMIIHLINTKKWNISEHVIKLRYEFRHGYSVDNIIKYMKDNNVKPDRYCMLSAKRNNNQSFINFLLDKLKCDPPFECLKPEGSYSSKFYEYYKNKINQTEVDYTTPYDHIDLNSL